MLTPFWSASNGETTQTIYLGDVLEVLKKLPNESVQCVVTSPPYWGLRNYGAEGQIGLEPSIEAHVDIMVRVFREVRRVLRRTGTLWMNLGDAFAQASSRSHSNSNHDGGNNTNKAFRSNRYSHGANIKAPKGLKPKDLIGIPWHVAFALQADGWYLRSDIIWEKPSAMPESVTDRPTRAHEYVFLMTKSPRYFYDADAIRERPLSPSSEVVKMPDGWDTGAGAHGSFHREGREKGRVKRQDKQRGHSRRHAGFNDRWDAMGKTEQQAMGRNKRTVWTVAAEPFAGKHFATFPTALITPMLLAGTSPKACPYCQAPWERIVEKTGGSTGVGWTDHADDLGKGKYKDMPPNALPYQRIEKGWRPTCTCENNDGSGKCVVLDPFNGSGTTLLVAQRLGRNGIGIELSQEYCNLAVERIEREHRQFRLPIGGETL